jgi:hypothetical protein
MVVEAMQKGAENTAKALGNDSQYTQMMLRSANQHLNGGVSTLYQAATTEKRWINRLDNSAKPTLKRLQKTTASLQHLQQQLAVLPYGDRRRRALPGLMANTRPVAPVKLSVAHRQVALAAEKIRQAGTWAETTTQKSDPLAK